MIGVARKIVGVARKASVKAHALYALSSLTFVGDAMA